MKTKTSTRTRSEEWHHPELSNSRAAFSDDASDLTLVHQPADVHRVGCVRVRVRVSESACTTSRVSRVSRRPLHGCTRECANMPGRGGELVVRIRTGASGASGAAAACTMLLTG